MSIVDTVLHKVFGTPHERKVKQLRPVIEKIHAVRMALEALDDAALAAKSAEFREKLKNVTADSVFSTSSSRNSALTSAASDPNSRMW